MPSHAEDPYCKNPEDPMVCSLLVVYLRISFRSSRAVIKSDIVMDPDRGGLNDVTSSFLYMLS